MHNRNEFKKKMVNEKYFSGFIPFTFIIYYLQIHFLVFNLQKNWPNVLLQIKKISNFLTRVRQLKSDRSDFHNNGCHHILIEFFFFR